MTNPPTARQMRAARALSGLDQNTLAARTGLSIATIKNIESDRLGPLRVSVATLTSVARVLEEAGVTFTPAQDGRGVGVCLIAEAQVSESADA